MIKHTLLALVVQAACWAAGHFIWDLGLIGLIVGANTSSAVFFGRELGQAEYRWMTANGESRATAPWYAGFIPSAWNDKSVTDWLVPTIATVGVLYLGASGTI